jgi:hypothetical protein
LAGFLLLATACCAFAETRTYLLYRARCFPQDRYLETISPTEYKYFIDTGKKNINAAGGQPFRLTTYELNYSSKYATWGVTYNDKDELKHMDKMVKINCAVLLSTMDVVSVYDPRIGGSELQLEVSGALANYPTDYYYVDPSSGT